MKTINKRQKKERSKKHELMQRLQDFAYFETVFITLLYLLIGYIINPEDICITQSHISYMVVLLALITLFHGFEKGMLATGILALAMWFSYEQFLYVDFLVALMMMLLFSEFHYYWTRKIKEAQTNAQYYELKLNELSRAFYTLKTSHDQLEKNYVIKPMSLRNSLKTIKDSQGDITEKYEDFLKLLRTSFNVSLAQTALQDESTQEYKVIHAFGAQDETVDFHDILIQEVLQKKKPIYISDDTKKKSRYIAVIPALYFDEVMGLLLIEKMPFMSFNKENLTSISILFEYFVSEMRKAAILERENFLSMISDEEFRYEYFRLEEICKLYQIDSLTFVIKLHDPLLAERLFITTKNILRSLDMAVKVETDGSSCIVLLFPFADAAAGYGFLNRLLLKLGDVNENDYETMTFSYSKASLLEHYLSSSRER
ncbi:MAG: PelD GGDEF domain-containing protein [Thiovulaceae bacterium]|nr:PelD GGDEF domain-containing protein [Sulfurimonadaceae bacterium]